MTEPTASDWPAWWGSRSRPDYIAREIVGPHDLAEFRRVRLIADSAAGWDAFDESLRAVYEKPTDRAETHDQSFEPAGWGRLFQALLDDWDTRYEAAGGRWA